MRSDEAFTEVSALTAPEAMQASFRDLLERGSVLEGQSEAGPAGPQGRASAPEGRLEPEAVGPQGREPWALHLRARPGLGLRARRNLAIRWRCVCIGPVCRCFLRLCVNIWVLNWPPNSLTVILVASRPGGSGALRRRPAWVQLGATSEGDVEAGGGGDVVVKGTQIVALELH